MISEKRAIIFLLFFLSAAFFVQEQFDVRRSMFDVGEKSHFTLELRTSNFEPRTSPFALLAQQVTARVVPQESTEYEYKIGAKDLLQISVFEVPDLNITVRVSEDGSITLPLLGRIDVGWARLLLAKSEDHAGELHRDESRRRELDPHADFRAATSRLRRWLRGDGRSRRGKPGPDQ